MGALLALNDTCELGSLGMSASARSTYPSRTPRQSVPHPRTRAPASLYCWRTDTSLHADPSFRTAAAKDTGVRSERPAEFSYS